jgi:DNA repair photolyase
MRTQISTSTVAYRPAHSILTRATGFIRAFDYTLNPYSGCSFGCTYCYAAFFARTTALQADWGRWVQVKENALALLQKRRSRPLIDQSIYMSSVTDPYQPVEKDLGLTRALLEELLNYHQVRLVIQTRSPLVTRDLDLLREFKQVRVNMTVTTDDDTVRRVFEPTCPANQQRLDAISQVQAIGVSACITMTPLLPVRSPETFAQQLQATGVRRFVVQEFHATQSRFVAGTGVAARVLAQQMGWDHARYREVTAVLRQHLPDLQEGQAGFVPVWEGD